jgi:hypothetical protein
MQTLEFTRALQRIVSDLKARELVAFLSQYLAANTQPNKAISVHDKDAFSILIVGSISGISRLENDPVARQIIDSLKIPELYAGPRIGKLIGAFNTAGSVQNLVTSHETFIEFTSFLAMLGWLSNLADACTSLLEKARIAPLPPEKEVVEFEIIGDNGKDVEADRLRRFFSSLIELHSQLALLLEIKDARLEVAYMDSGSVLAGIAMAVGIARVLKTLLREIWQEIKYEPFEQLDKKMDSLDKVLSLAKKIDEQVESKTLTEEVGRNLKHRILTEALALIEVGAMIPAENPTEEKEQRKLLGERRMKLLASGDAPQSDSKSKA